MENLKDTQDRYSKYVMPTYAPKMLFTRGQGSRLWDADGKEYLDFATGIAVCNGEYEFYVVTVNGFSYVNSVGIVNNGASDIGKYLLKLHYNYLPY